VVHLENCAYGGVPWLYCCSATVAEVANIALLVLQVALI
jgi:hypothetical protein